MKFKTDDVVKCISDKDWIGVLKNGDTYVVTSCYRRFACSEVEWVQLLKIDTTPIHDEFLAGRFVRVGRFKKTREITWGQWIKHMLFS